MHEWIPFGLGIWLLLSPWLLGFSDLNLTTWNNIIVGVLLILWSLKEFLEKRSEE